MARNAALSTLSLSLILLAAACSGGDAPQPADETQGGWGVGAEIDRYTVRGEIVSLPGPGGRGAFDVRHEAIPDFRSSDGEVVGMGSMTMPFPLAEGLSLDGFAVGDKIEFTLEVNWDPEATPPQRVTRVQKLPAETDLDFGEGHEAP